MQSEWRVACVRIPRFPIAAVWRSARRGDLGASDVQLLLPFQAMVEAAASPSSRQERPSSSRERSFSPASAAAPNPTTARPTSVGTSAPNVVASAPGHWDEHPIVLSEGNGTRRRLRAVSAAAARSGIRAGMSVAEARAMCAGLEELPWDEVAIAGAVTEATAMLLEASPQVTPVRGAPGTWWIGASGFGGTRRAGQGQGSRAGERALAHVLHRIGARWHPRTRVAIADSCVAARAATWAGVSFGQGGDERSLVCIVPAGHDAAYLAPAPLALVPMDEELRDALQALGLRSLGSFAALPSGEVERRWGEIGLQAWRLARGEDRRRPVLARVPTHPEVEAELATPSATMEPVLFLVRAALERLSAQLASDGRAIATLAITLTLDDARGALPDARAHTVTREVRPARPVARVAPLFEHCRALLDRWTLTAPVCAVAVAVVASAPLSGEQGNLLSTQWRDPAAVDAALARLRAELGPDVVVKPVSRDTHRPEKAGAWNEDTAATSGEALPGATRQAVAPMPDESPSPRPGGGNEDERSRVAPLPFLARAHPEIGAARIGPRAWRRSMQDEGGSDGGMDLRPGRMTNGGGDMFTARRAGRPPGASSSGVSVVREATTRLLEQPEAIAVQCDGEVPRVVVWRGQRLAVERAAGPERLSGDWWDDGYRRDYWRCEHAGGDFVIYLDRATEEWWMQGWHD